MAWCRTMCYVAVHQACQDWPAHEACLNLCQFSSSKKARGPRALTRPKHSAQLSSTHSPTCGLDQFSTWFDTFNHTYKRQSTVKQFKQTSKRWDETIRQDNTTTKKRDQQSNNKQRTAVSERAVGSRALCKQKKRHRDVATMKDIKNTYRDKTQRGKAPRPARQRN